MAPDDLRRSIAATVIAIVGQSAQDAVPGGGGPDHQWFWASFANQASERFMPSASGIGQRPLSTVVSASLVAPVHDLADLVAGRILAEAITDLDGMARRQDDDGELLVREMFERFDLGPLWTREVPALPPPDPLPKGAGAIRRALLDRLESMETELSRLEGHIDAVMASLLDHFRPGRRARDLLRAVDPFQLEKQMTGLPGHRHAAAEMGFLGMLELLSSAPQPPEGVGSDAPQLPLIRRTAGGMRPARWSDPGVQQVVHAQDMWYSWQGRQLWHQKWKDREAIWRPVMDRAAKDLSALVEHLRRYAERERERFTERHTQLYAGHRIGTRYLLPPVNTLGDLCDQVLAKLLPGEGQANNRGAADLIKRLLEPDGWMRSPHKGTRTPEAVLAEIEDIVRQQVTEAINESEGSGAGPLLPSLQLLLETAAGDDGASQLAGSPWLDQFRSQLAGLVPEGFAPEGSGRLTALVVHPQTQDDDRAAAFLREHLGLPPDVPEFRAVDTDSITVVLLRSGMSLGDVPEVRRLMQTWAAARDDPSGEDFLAWRQRLGYRDDSLAATEADRRRILHHVLCAMWNGQVDITGAPHSPEQIRIRVQHEDAAAITLRLEAFEDNISSWAGLLRAYEQCALLDEGRIIEGACRRLMSARPKGLDTTPEAPSTLFLRLVHEVAPRQLALIRELAERFPARAHWLVPLRDFWEKTFPGALDLRFPGASRASRPTLRALEQHHARGRTQPTADAPTSDHRGT
ncbi:hypothetical protein GLX30_05990 [Streptomyces sp. Tu 2975]|uniref:hypothetical protein n=1 Tax=Streptomyces sp. Tu 2975 TaxID=2676871 RepID=UPI00135990A4|nr:hypothetical protein [Streptomyces sp. Tu 2975]QIP83688.1 hypothetical protein GLX30_05990 [Streptomyces sp. Tu 2975]